MRRKKEKSARNLAALPRDLQRHIRSIRLDSSSSDGSDATKLLRALQCARFGAKYVNRSDARKTWLPFSETVLLAVRSDTSKQYKVQTSAVRFWTQYLSFKIDDVFSGEENAHVANLVLNVIEFLKDPQCHASLQQACSKFLKVAIAQRGMDRFVEKHFIAEFGEPESTQPPEIRFMWIHFLHIIYSTERVLTAPYLPWLLDTLDDPCNNISQLAWQALQKVLRQRPSLSILQMDRILHSMASSLREGRHNTLAAVRDICQIDLFSNTKTCANKDTIFLLEECMMRVACTCNSREISTCLQIVSELWPSNLQSWQQAYQKRAADSARQYFLKIVTLAYVWTSPGEMLLGERKAKRREAALGPSQESLVGPQEFLGAAEGLGSNIADAGSGILWQCLDHEVPSIRLHALQLARNISVSVHTFLEESQSSDPWLMNCLREIVTNLHDMAVDAINDDNVQSQALALDIVQTLHTEINYDAAILHTLINMPDSELKSNIERLVADLKVSAVDVCKEVLFTPLDEQCLKSFASRNQHLFDGIQKDTGSTMSQILQSRWNISSGTREDDRLKAFMFGLQ